MKDKAIVDKKTNSFATSKQWLSWLSLCLGYLTSQVNIDVSLCMNLVPWGKPSIDALCCWGGQNSRSSHMGACSVPGALNPCRCLPSCWRTATEMSPGGSLPSLGTWCQGMPSPLLLHSALHRGHTQAKQFILYLLLTVRNRGTGVVLSRALELSIVATSKNKLQQ